ncbi:Tfp pilus assembly protein PilF [Sphaerochaeta pleomorpha str. Grapes]|uniref:Tfp pilus assembly protein PilF n=1 Tax=Sphaerochaeta pleomorpha (strain ATCC BAA-1885 / DSM 22778 / Grapes) TaxID=158190 RepID=G8QUZ2_SPHPG|nr:tetratricopeptide repeat protein [Sphaerochaeta pleomorpha]AEV28168.1 Tfp pilus assembly protein PilF [Sphaerochaeta pleomorpha str. Grapes]
MKKYFIVSIVCILCLASCATGLGKNEKDLAALKELGTVYLDNGEYEMALDAFDKALAIDAQDSEVLYNKVLVLLASGAYENAITLCDVSFNSYPAKLRFLKAKAAALIKLKKTDEAFQVYRQIISLDAGDYALRATVMEFALEQGFEDVARSEATFLLERQEEVERAISTLAILEGEKNTYSLIEAYLDSVTEV